MHVSIRTEPLKGLEQLRFGQDAHSTNEKVNAGFSNLEDVLESLLDFIHDFEEGRMHVTQQREGHSCQNPRVSIGWPWAHEQTGGHLHKHILYNAPRR